MGTRTVLYELVQVLYRDANVAYGRGASDGHPDLLFCCYADHFDREDAQKSPTAKRPERYPALDGPFKVAFVAPLPEPDEHLLSLVAFGCRPGWTLLAYRWLPVIPLWLHLARVVSVRRTEALKLTAQVARAAAFLHGADRLSLQIHPANVFVDATEGQRAYLGYDGDLGPTLHPKLVERNVHLQRFLTKAPEQIWGEKPTIASDVFQLGVLAVTMMTRKYLVPPSSPATLDPADYPPAEFTADLPKGLDDLAARTLAAAPGARFPSAAAVVEFLEGDTSNIPLICQMSEAMAGRHTAMAVKLAPKQPGRRGRRAAPRDEGPPSAAIASAMEGTSATRPWWTLPALAASTLAVLGLLLVAGPSPRTPAPTSGAPAPTVSSTPTPRPAPPTRVPAAAAPPQGKYASLPALAEDVIRLRRVATNETTFDEKVEFLRRTFITLSPGDRERAIGERNLRAIVRMRQRDPAQAWQRLDETFERLQAATEPQ